MADKKNNRDKFTSKQGDFVIVSEAEFRRQVKKPRAAAGQKQKKK